jgi:hypothetical protein
MENYDNNGDVSKHTTHISNKLDELIDHLREDIQKVEDPKAQALFETAAEVLAGLKKAFKDYEEKSEKTWQEVNEEPQPQG